MKSRPVQFAETLGIILLGVPVLGVLFGGVYLLPAIMLTKEREPWLSLLLSVSLAITVFGLGRCFHTPIAFLFGVWATTIVLLLIAKLVYGSLGHNLERFGMVHIAAIFITVLVSAAAKVGSHTSAP
jgi:hypothetical protein